MQQKLGVERSDRSAPQEHEYEVLAYLVSGGMAEIYLGQRALPNEAEPIPVILKRLRPELEGTPEYVNMFLDEVRAISALRHPNIVQLYGHGLMEGSHFMAMELLRGVNLMELIQRRLKNKATVPVPIVVNLLMRALEALAYAHEECDAGGKPLNLVHRDVSPRNLVVDWSGRLKLLDFGVAWSEGRIQVTRPGRIKGTVPYMAPEQLQAAALDGRTDLFSLAVVIYHLLMLKYPFPSANEEELVTSILTHEVNPPSWGRPDVSEALSNILLKALAKKPEGRFHSAKGMLNAVRALGTPEQPAWASDEAVGAFVSEAFPGGLPDDQAPLTGSIQRRGWSSGRISTPEERARLSVYSRLYEPELAADPTNLRKDSDASPPPANNLKLPEQPISSIPVKRTATWRLWAPYVTPLILVALIWGYLGWTAQVRSVDLWVESVPTGASIRINGEETGQVTPHNLKGLSPEQRTLELILEGYRKCRVTLEKPVRAEGVVRCELKGLQ